MCLGACQTSMIEVFARKKPEKKLPIWTLFVQWKLIIQNQKVFH